MSQVLSGPTAPAAEVVDDVAVWHPAAGVTVRGTVLLVVGRGEHPGLYARLGRRLAFDGYRVQALPEVLAPTGSADLAERVADARRAAAGPVVLAGADTGALVALAAAAGAARADALLLAGVPDTGSAADGAPAGAPRWSDEYAARTACTVHRELLAADPAFRPGRLGVPVPAELAAPALAAVPELPVLLLHGLADPVAPPRAARRLAERLPYAELVLVADGLHDILNDAAHRTVAAQLVQWLERLRLADGRPRLPVLAVTTTEGENGHDRR